MKPRRSNRRGNGAAGNENSPEKREEDKNTEETIPKSKTPPDKSGSPGGHVTATVTSSVPTMHHQEHQFRMAATPPGGAGFNPGSVPTGRGNGAIQPHSGVPGSLPSQPHSGVPGSLPTQPHSGVPGSLPSQPHSGGPGSLPTRPPSSGGLSRRLTVSEYDEVPGDNESPFALRKQPESPKMAPVAEVNFAFPASKFEAILKF